MAFAVNRPARLSLRCLTTRQASLALRTAQLLPLKGLSTLGSDPARFQARPPACYRAPWRLPGPDFHRQATTSFRSGHDRWTITSVISGRTGWSTSEASLGPPSHVAGLSVFVQVARWPGTGPRLPSRGSRLRRDERTLKS